MLIANLNSNSIQKNQSSSLVQKQEKAGFSSASQVQAYHSSPSAENLRAYSLPRLSFGSKQSDVDKVMRGNKNLKVIDVRGENFNGRSFTDGDLNDTEKKVRLQKEQEAKEVAESSSSPCDNCTVCTIDRDTLAGPCSGGM